MSASTNPVTSESVVRLMKNAATYPDPTTSVQVSETHISWVFLTDRYAYKLKKPVQFEFLNFSTPELRHHACLEELRLNRRLAPDVYIAVLPITGDSSGRLSLNGSGQEVDWVVQMRRLPAEKSLDVVLREKRLRPEDGERIAKHLTSFYTGLPRKAVRSDDYRQALDHHIRANGKALLDSMTLEQSRLRRIQSAQLRYVHVQVDSISDRVAAGRIVDGHGDLRPEHIYLDDRPLVIDCIEFSDALRTVDIADELSFLSMECQRLGDGGVGAAVIAEYQKVSGDKVPESLLDFYRGYRALVRAKVGLLRKQQLGNALATLSADPVRQYIDLADGYVAKLGPPMLLIVGGLMGTGKSTLATKLAEIFAVELFSTDHIRRAKLGSSETPAGYGEGHYQPDLRTQVYDELLRQAGALLKDRQSVVLDGTFLTDGLRQRAFNLGYENGAVTLHVECTCPRQIAYARIQQRMDLGQSESEARTELYDLQAIEREPPLADDPSMTLDTTESMSQQLQAVCAELRHLLFD